MYVDIRQAAELLAKVTGTNPIYQAQQISLAGQFHGLEFRGPGKSLWEWRPGIFTTATGEDGKVYVRPAGHYKGDRRKALQAIRGEAETDEAGDNELVTPYFTVSIADIVTNPFFRFDAEIQEQILEAHKAAAVALLPAETGLQSRKKWTTEKLAKLEAYRQTHTMPDTAKEFGISEQRIRQLLPTKKAAATPFSGLVNRAK